jgi:hypothetical protein
MRTNLLIRVLFGLLLSPGLLTAQSPPPTPPPQPPAEPDDEGLTVRGSSVGYIDTAAVGNQVRFRSDFGYRFPFPNRAEFFYAKSRPNGPGLPQPERSIDFQDLTVYGEKTLFPGVSAFVETGARFLNPEINANTAGWSDSAVGMKYAFYSSDNLLGTFQFRTYVPTGDAGRGLGTRHVSLEPGLLGFGKLTDRLGLAGELRYWIPVGGTDFAGSVLRYGLGTRYDLWERAPVRFAPTVEFIGWTVLAGQQSRLAPVGTSVPQSAAGVTVVNVKVGARVDVGDRLGFYAGYGRAMTGEEWYADIFRIEMRWLY